VSASSGLGRARSWLYVPAHRPELVAKALAGGADAVVLDLEDAVPATAKATARAAAVAACAAPRQRPLWVRVNGLDTEWAEADLAALAGTGPGPDGVRLPKATDPARVAAVAARLGRPLHPQLENARGIEEAFELARCHPLVGMVSLGETDLAADLRVRDPAALAWARSRVVVANRAAGLPSPMASVWTDLTDPEGLARDSASARDAGFHGRSVIHPAQLEPVHRAFTPSRSEIDRAQALVDSVHTAAAAGHSAYLDERGRFVDPAVVEGARWVLDLARSLPADTDVPATSRQLPDRVEARSGKEYR
jgi:citrate lyase subunit beta/citryl-CoA lyase